MKTRQILYILLLFTVQLCYAQSFNSAYKPKVRDYDVTSLTFAIEIDQKLFAVHNYQNDTNLNKHIIITRFEENGSVRWAKEYTGEQMVVRSSMETADKHILITGRPFIAISPLSVRILKIDTLGTIVWSKSYSVPSLYSNTAAVSLSETNDAYALIFNASTFNSFAGTFTSDIMAVKVNKESGVMVSQTALESTASLQITYAKALENDHYLFAGNLNNITNPGVGFIMEASSSGDILWKKKFIDNDIYRILFGKVIEHEGSYYQIGTLTYQSDNFSVSSGYLMKINNNGNIVYIKSYKNSAETGGTRFKTLEKTENGFRIFGSYSNADNSSNVFVMDVDETGAIISNEAYNWGVSNMIIYNGIGIGAVIGNEISGRTMHDGSFLFQNLSLTSCVADDYNFSMMRTDANQQMQCENLLETLNVVDSLITIQSEDFSAFSVTRNITESEFTNISSIPFEWERYDLCDCALIEDNTSNSQAEINSKTEQLKVFPNPSNGNVHITGLTQGDELFIFDLTGRMIHSDYADTNSIHLSLSVKDGLYIMSLTRKDGTVHYQRIQVTN